MPEERPPVRPRMYVRVPPERLGAVIGEGGRNKLEVMRRTGTVITVDSENSMVIIEPESPATPPYNVMKAAEVVKAVALGFPLEKALRLLEEDQVLVVIDLKQRVGDAPNHLRRVKARIIGEGGRARRTIEQMAGAQWVDEPVVVDGNLVTARYPPDIPFWMREFMRLLERRGLLAPYPKS